MYLILLPLLSFVLILYFLCHRTYGTDPRRAFLSAAVIWGIITTVITEILSILNMLTGATLASCWGATAVGAALVLDRRGSLLRRLPHWTVRSLPLGGVIMSVPIVAILLATAFIAVLGWPNQWDTMVYHLSRVDHWAQNKSVAFYPTHIVRQLYNPPWSEYAILNLTLLSGDERFANLPQWFSMLGSLVGVSVIAKDLGATPLGQLFAALFCATIPMGILQASGTQNDYVTGFWFVCMIDALLAPQQAPRAQALSIGATLGLALLTKGTSYIFAGPLLLTLCLAKKISAHHGMLRRAGLIAVVALALNTPHYIRNLDTFGSILGPRNLGSATEVDDNLTNDTFSPPILISNLIRNAALHVGTPLPGFNSLVETVIEQWHTWLGIDVNDPRSTRLYPEKRFAIVAMTNSPDLTGNPFHLFLIVLATVLIVVSRQPKHNRVLCIYVLALVAAFVLFSSLLKWQPWHSRLHLPLFVLWSPVIGVLYGLHPTVLLLAGLLVTVQAWSPLVHNYLHPLTGQRSIVRTARLDQYFRSHSSSMKAEYLGAAEFLHSRSCAGVGLLLGWDDFEHPLWVLLPEVRAPGGRVQHIGVSNSSAHLESRSPLFTPCAVFAISEPNGDKLAVGRSLYRLAWSSNRVKVFLVDVSAQRSVSVPQWRH
jgi:hypothetical protein